MISDSKHSSFKMDVNMRKTCTANCPISHRTSISSDPNRKNLLSYIFSGYETCDSTELRDVCQQTDINLLDWDDQYFENIIEKFTSVNDVGDSRPVEEYADVIESGDEEFHSVKEDNLDVKQLDPLHSINIKLMDSPHIILEDGMHKTKITLTSNYLEKNGLELIIGEGPARNVKLKAGDAEIYPSDNALPPDINISVTEEKDPEGKEAEVDVSHERNKYCGFESPGRRLGMLSLVVDNLEQQNIQYVDGKFRSFHPGGNIVQCITDYDYLREYDKREVGIIEEKNSQTLGKIQKAMAEMDTKRQKDPETVKRQEKEMYKRVKKKFFKNVLEGDPRLDLVKKKLIEDLVRKGYETPVKEKFKSTDAQTEVHIDPGATDDFSFSDDSDSILRRFYALRDFSALSYSTREPSQTKDNKEVEEKTDKNNTHDATMGQIDTDFSVITEPTMEGISDLTERNVAIEKEKDDATDEDVSDISAKPKKSHSVTSIEKRSKLIDTHDLEEEIKDVAVMSDRQIRTPSLIKALKSFDEELNPLQQELNRLLSDFKSIDIPEDVQMSVAAERLPELPSTLVYSPKDRPSTSSQHHPNPDESIHHLYRNNVASPTGGETCHCAPGTCLGFGRSSGIICRRIRRLPPTASSSEFFREFTRPAWVTGSFRPTSILSEPEDIYGDRVHRRPPSSMSIHSEDISNKSESN